jgi:hypothetical protein
MDSRSQTRGNGRGGLKICVATARGRLSLDCAATFPSRISAQSLECLHVFHRNDPAWPCFYCASGLQCPELAAHSHNAQTEIVANLAVLQG